MLIKQIPRNDAACFCLWFSVHPTTSSKPHVQEMEQMLQDLSGNASSTKSEILDLRKQVDLLEEDRRTQDQEVKQLQNENERDKRKEREMLQDKNNSLNKEITRLTMLMSQYGDQRDNNKVDSSMLERINTVETELDEV